MLPAPSRVRKHPVMAVVEPSAPLAVVRLQAYGFLGMLVGGEGLPVGLRLSGGAETALARGADRVDGHGSWGGLRYSTGVRLWAHD
jgi:hypothetical protein